MFEPYFKPPITFELQLDQLINRGLVVSDRNIAIDVLMSVSYYRLSAYWYPFRQRDVQGNINNALLPGICFSEILQLYEFDRKLRLLVLDAIERIEVAIRTRITYHMAHAYGAFAHADSAHFHPNFNHANWLAKLETEIQRSSDEFIRHYRKKYSGFPRVPIWMSTEIMSFGALSLFYGGLRNDHKIGIEDKKAIANHFNVHHKRLGNWLHTLTYVRNVCAHHSRLWNRELAIRPDLNKEKYWQSPITPRNDRIFYVLLILRYLLQASGDGWQQEVTNLLIPITKNSHHRVAMGIPEHWQEHPVWRGK